MYAIRQLKIAHVAYELEQLVWSNQVDLVAVANCKGEVALHRLLWPKAWDFPPPRENCKVTALAWRPDGKVLAIGYTGGTLLLINVEDKSVLHTINVNVEITCLSWIVEKKLTPNTAKQIPEDTSEEEKSPYMQFIDYSKDFIAKPPSLTNYDASTSTEEAPTSLLHNQKYLNLLLIGTDVGTIHMSVFGSLSCGIIDVSSKIQCHCSIVDINLTDDLNMCYALVKTNTERDQFPEGDLKVVFISTNIFQSHARELFCLAMKRVETQSLYGYLYKSISSVMETWESILLEIDAKLSNYASKVPPGTLSADFLELLLFGICSDDMQEFLFRDMTKRGLEKFSQNIEMSYGNIQNLLLKHITKVGQNITYHLSELRGMSRFAARYGILGLDESKITAAISANGSFLIKSGEMQEIINNSMIYYKTFFRWLFAAIINLVDEQVPSEIPSMTQKDLAYIASFVQYFDRIGCEKNVSAENGQQSGFIMERLGQYLSNGGLTISVDNETNAWEQLLKEQECLGKHPAIIKHFKENSLIQQFAHLRQHMDDIFKGPEMVITENMDLIECVPLINNCGLVRATGINSSRKSVIHAFPNFEANAIYLLEFHIGEQMRAKGGILFIHPENEIRFRIIDAKFYTENVLTILIEDLRTRLSSLVQCQLAAYREQLVDVRFDIALAMQPNLVRFDVHDACVKNIGMIASKFAVSGFRSVAIVLADNGKKVMLFEMEAEEEEEDDVDVTSSTIRESDVDASMQEASDLE